MSKPGEYAGIARISGRFVRSGKEEVVAETEEIIDPAVFTSAPAIVTRGYGLTLNLGNYESARFDVSLSMPCYPEDVDACDKWCAAWTEQRVQAEVSAVRGSKGGKSGGSSKGF
jgi:hypothetical protein